MTRLWLLLPFTIAALAALAISGQTYLSMIDHGHAWWRIFGWQFGGWAFWAAACPFLLPHRHRATRPLAWGTAGRAAVLVPFHVVWVAWLTTLFQPFVPVDTHDFREAFFEQALPFLWIDVLIVPLLVAINVAWRGQRRTRELELRESRLEAELARAELEALRLQIQPHFLFNALNSIAALVRQEHGTRALEMLVGLSDLLRATLEQGRTQLVPLASELHLVERYLDLQRVRFPERLETIEWHVDEDCLELLLPSLLLQPLAENAVRHGVAKVARKGRLVVRAQREGQHLQLEIEDDGAGLSAEFVLEASSGVGLSNACSRLEQLYGDDASLSVAPASPRGTRVSVRIPCQPLVVPETESRFDSQPVAKAARQ